MDIFGQGVEWMLAEKILINIGNEREESIINV